MKRLLIEVTVSDEGAKDPQRAGFLIEDALYDHIGNCSDREGEEQYFGSRNVVARTLTEERPL